VKPRNFFLWITAFIGLLFIQSNCQFSGQKASLVIDKSTDFLFYCSEFVYHVFNRAKIPVQWVYSEFPTEQARENIRKLGLKQSHFITQGDYVRMPDFSYIGCSID
jgi:hypothetical protein